MITEFGLLPLNYIVALIALFLVCVCVCGGGGGGGGV